jgi:hypothetical protein
MALSGFARASSLGRIVNPIVPFEPGTDWIDQLTDDQCLEVFWLYLEKPEEFFAQHPAALLGQALRYALKAVVAEHGALEPSDEPL